MRQQIKQVLAFIYLDFSLSFVFIFCGFCFGCKDITSLNDIYAMFIKKSEYPLLSYIEDLTNVLLNSFHELGESGNARLAP